MSIHKLSRNLWIGPTRIFWCYCLPSSLIYINLLFRLFENDEITLKIVCLIRLLTNILLRNVGLLRNQDFQLHQDLLHQDFQLSVVCKESDSILTRLGTDAWRQPQCVVQCCPNLSLTFVPEQCERRYILAVTILQKIIEVDADT